MTSQGSTATRFRRAIERMKRRCLCGRPFIGDVDGFVIDAGEHITHVVLERGHLWGRKEVTIPIGRSPGSKATQCTSRCPRTRSAPSQPFASADTADAPPYQSASLRRTTARSAGAEVALPPISHAGAGRGRITQVSAHLLARVSASRVRRARGLHPLPPQPRWPLEWITRT